SSELTGIRNVCGQRYLYSPDDANGGRDWSAEKYLGNLEKDAGKLWPDLVDGRLPLDNASDRVTLARFVAALHIRNVHLFNLIGSTMSLRDRLFGPLSPDVLASRAAHEPDPTHPGRHFVHVVRTSSERISRLLVNMQWLVLRVQRDFFVTSDR